MKTSLKFLALLFTASVPSALAAEVAGLHLPVGIDALDVFYAFVVALVSLIVLGDYSQTTLRAASSAAARSSSRVAPKASHPLAA